MPPLRQHAQPDALLPRRGAARARRPGAGEALRARPRFRVGAAQPRRAAAAETGYTLLRRFAPALGCDAQVLGVAPFTSAALAGMDADARRRREVIQGRPALLFLVAGLVSVDDALLAESVAAIAREERLCVERLLKACRRAFRELC